MIRWEDILFWFLESHQFKKRAIQVNYINLYWPIDVKGLRQAAVSSVQAALWKDKTSHDYTTILGSLVFRLNTRGRGCKLGWAPHHIGIVDTMIDQFSMNQSKARPGFVLKSSHLFAFLNMKSWLRLINQEQNDAIDPYSNVSYHDFFQILKIRAQTEGIQVDDESLTMLGETGSKTTLRCVTLIGWKMRSRGCMVL